MPFILVMTSPPFALQRKKEYGNKDQNEYLDWITEFGKAVYRKLRDDGSFVLDLGGSYQKGVPARSLYNFRVPIRFCDEIGFFLAEDFYWHNPSKLPSPIEWVNKRKIRAKDSVNTVWWFGKTEWPKADVSKVLSLRVWLMKAALISSSCQPPDHEADAGDGNPGNGAFDGCLDILRRTAARMDRAASCRSTCMSRLFRNTAIAWVTERPSRSCSSPS